MKKLKTCFDRPRMNSCKTCGDLYLKLSTREQCYDCLACPPAPKKKNRTKKVEHKGTPRQLFHECLILKGTHIDRHVLSEMCDACRYLPIDETTDCSAKHRVYLERVMLKDEHNEIDFKRENHYLTFPCDRLAKVEILLNLLCIDFQIMHISDQIQLQDINIHPGVDLEESLEDDLFSPISARIMTYVESSSSNTDADKLIEFSRILRSKGLRNIIPAQAFELRRGQLFMNIRWPNVGNIMVNITSCRTGADIYRELKHVVNRLN